MMLCVLITSTVTFAADTLGENVVDSSNRSKSGRERIRDSLIKQSTKKADIDAEVDTQALKLGGIHRREEARQYLELKNQAEESHEKLIEKSKNQTQLSGEESAK